MPVLKLLGRTTLWNLLPNGKSAHFYNFWAGLWRRNAFRARLRADLTQVFQQITDGTLSPQIAARIPLEDAASALLLAESGTVAGKVILVG
jgi:NADPH:quinone reductase-like Zn-dependent oxidoreductase